jgi:AcrR family transcriptional regulator
MAPARAARTPRSTRRARSNRGTRQPLSRERVLAAGVTVADAEGLRAVTMRRVAEHLGCEAMTLYYYVDDKAGLLAGLTESIVDEVSAATLDPQITVDVVGWVEVVRRRCLAAREVMLRHPWAPSLVATRSQVPPNVAPIFEALVGTMTDGGCSYELAHRAIHALGSMLFGFTQELFEPAADDDGSSQEEFAAMAVALPHLARLAEVAVHEARGSLSVCDTQSEFEFTLGLILDGLEAHRLAEARGVGERGVQGRVGRTFRHRQG